MARGKKKTGRGGARPGSGRKPGPPELVRHNRLSLVLTDSEQEQLQREADREGIPIATLGHRIIARALRRRRGRP